jgi:hypothetical protein
MRIGYFLSAEHCALSPQLYIDLHIDHTIETTVYEMNLARRQPSHSVICYWPSRIRGIWSRLSVALIQLVS